MWWLAVVAPMALGADWFVEAGTGLGTGTSADPFGTVQEGLQAAQPGDRVVLADGVYEPAVSVRDGNLGGRITLVAANPGGALIQGAGRAFTLGHSYHTVQGVVFDGAYGPLSTVHTHGGHHSEWHQVEIRRSGGHCMDLSDVATVLIEDSRIHHCVSVKADAHGIAGGSVYDLTVRDTEVYLVTNAAISVSTEDEELPWDRLVVQGCTLYSGPLDETVGRLLSGAVIGHRGISINSAVGSPSVVIRDTTVWGFNEGENAAGIVLKDGVDAWVDRVTLFDLKVGFRLRGPNTEIRIQNALVYDARTAVRLEENLGTPAIYHMTVGPDVTRAFEDVAGPPAGLDLRNTLVLGPEGDLWVDHPDNIVGTSALVRDASQGDFSLMPAGSAIDAGVLIPDLTTDLLGNPRVVGDWPDVGALEHDMPRPTEEIVTDTGLTTATPTASGQRISRIVGVAGLQCSHGPGPSWAAGWLVFALIRRSRRGDHQL